MSSEKDDVPAIPDQPTVPQFPVDRIELNDTPIVPSFPSDRIEKGEQSGELSKD